MKLSRTRVTRFICGCGLLFAVTTTNATVITGEDLSGDLSGLEWLSFDDAVLDTRGRSYAEISDPGSNWSLGGWRYATTGELDTLFTSLGVGLGELVSNNTGVETIMNIWHPSASRESISALYDDGDISDGVSRTDLHEFWEKIHKAPPGVKEPDYYEIHHAEYQVETGIALHSTGLDTASWLVRESSGGTSVPAPVGAWLLFAGLCVMWARASIRPGRAF